jgi:hypothetical protein
MLAIICVEAACMIMNEVPLNLNLLLFALPGKTHFCDKIAKETY